MPAPALRVWGRRSAFNVQKVLWLIDELGLDHEHIEAGGAAGGLDRPEFLAMNPTGRVPVIDDDGTVVWESHTILRYLAASHGAKAFWSENPGERSQAERWMDWAQTSLQPAFMDLFWGYYRTPDEERDWLFVARALDRCRACFSLLDERLAASPYLAGDALTLGDIPAGTALYRYYELDIERPSLAHVEAWYARLAERPAYCRHVMRPFDELKGRKEY